MLEASRIIQSSPVLLFELSTGDAASRTREDNLADFSEARFGDGSFVWQR
jgi:hypothetical protein